MSVEDAVRNIVGDGRLVFSARDEESKADKGALRAIGESVLQFMAAYEDDILETCADALEALKAEVNVIVYGQLDSLEAACGILNPREFPSGARRHVILMNQPKLFQLGSRFAALNGEDRVAGILWAIGLFFMASLLMHSGDSREALDAASDLGECICPGLGDWIRETTEITTAKQPGEG